MMRWAWEGRATTGISSPLLELPARAKTYSSKVGRDSDSFERPGDRDEGERLLQ